MKILSLMLCCLLIPNTLMSQYGLAPILPMNNYQESKIFMSGIGNLGFDNFNGFYNPHYEKEADNFKVTTSVNVSLSYLDKIHEQEWTEVKSKLYVLPDISLKYQTDDLQFQLHLINDRLQKVSYKTTLEVKLNFPDRRYIITRFKFPDLSYTQYFIQLDAAYRLSENFSIAAGIASNYFKHSFYNNSAEEVPVREISHKLKVFTDLQFLAAVNYTDKCCGFYLNYKSLSNNNIMEKQTLHISDSLLYQYTGIFSESGILSCGAQLKMIPNLDLSLEYYMELSGMDNSYLLPGINIHAINNLDLGVLLGINVNTTGSTNVDLMDSFWLTSSIKYSFGNLDFVIHYQYSKSEYYSFLWFQNLESISHKIRFGVSLCL